MELLLCVDGINVLFHLYGSAEVTVRLLMCSTGPSVWLYFMRKMQDQTTLNFLYTVVKGSSDHDQYRNVWQSCGKQDCFKTKLLYWIAFILRAASITKWDDSTKGNTAYLPDENGENQEKSQDSAPGRNLKS